MRMFKAFLYSFLMLLVMASFSQCSSSKQFSEKAPLEFGEVYCQKWVAGVQGGGSGMNLMIPVEEFKVSLDSVYFRGKGVILEKDEQAKMYIGRFKDPLNNPKDYVMSGDPKEEYGNKLPDVSKGIRFDLKDNECVVSYKVKEVTQYFKIENVIEKEFVPYPTAPPNKQ